MIELYILVYINSQVLGMLVLAYIHFSICWVTAKAYAEAHEVSPVHWRWPKWYGHNSTSRWFHFFKGWVRPWETLARIGTRIDNEMVTIDYSRVWPSYRVNLNDKNKTHNRK